MAIPTHTPILSRRAALAGLTAAVAATPAIAAPEDDSAFWHALHARWKAAYATYGAVGARLDNAEFLADGNAIGAANDIPALRGEFERTSAVVDELETEISETPARSMAGIAVKLDLWLNQHEIDHSADAGSHAAFTALQDAMRLADMESAAA